MTWNLKKKITTYVKMPVSILFKIVTFFPRLATCSKTTIVLGKIYRTSYWKTFLFCWSLVIDSRLHRSAVAGTRHFTPQESGNISPSKATSLQRGVSTSTKGTSERLARERPKYASIEWVISSRK